MKVAIIHDYLIQIGGAERVLEALCEIFPEAPIYTLLYDEQSTNGIFKNKKIVTSFLQKIPFTKKHHRYFLALMPLAIEKMDLSDFDLIISSSSSYAKGVNKTKDALHICYCHTPLRYVWDDTKNFIKESHYPAFIKPLIPLVINLIKNWDLKAVSKVDYFIANSNFISGKIKKYYNRNSEVVYPPVKINNETGNEKDGKYFLIVSRLLPYKRIDIAIQAFNELSYLPNGEEFKLKIVGNGPEKKNLEMIAGKNVEFLGSKYDEELAGVYSECKAFIFPQEEDFGITAVEAQMAGRPVVAFKAGGALESVIDGRTGIFFDEQNKNSLMKAIIKFKDIEFDTQQIKNYAQKFSKEEFKKNIKNIIDEKIKIWNSNK